MENSVDPNQLASRKPADQDTHTVFKKDISGLSMLRVKNERQHMISNNLAFWQVLTQMSLCSLLLSLETPNAVQSVA